MTSSQPDPKLLNRLLHLEPATYAIAGATAAIILIAWLAPGVGRLLPDGWSLMKANTALSILLLITAMLLTRPNRSLGAVAMGKLLCLLVLVPAGAALLDHLTGSSSLFDTLLAEDPQGTMPGKMSMQTAGFLTLLSLTLIVESRRKETNSDISDLLTLALTLLTMVVLSAYLFGASNLFRQAEQTLTSPQTLLCMILLSFALMVRRIQKGRFSVLVSVGIGGRIARLLGPWILIIPFIIVSLGGYLAHAGWLTIAQSSSLTVSVSVTGFLVVVLFLAHKINQLESDLRNSSLTDEMTQLNNRRGFNLMGEHLYYECLREQVPMSLLFFDLDGLKQVNDSLGHETGSQLLCEFSALLRENFRQSDVIARLGGDEFVVTAKQADMSPALERFEQIVSKANQRKKRLYLISYSVGKISECPTADHAFEDLLARADALMYEEKRRKKAAH